MPEEVNISINNELLFGGGSSSSDDVDLQIEQLRRERIRILHLCATIFNCRVSPIQVDRHLTATISSLLSACQSTHEPLLPPPPSLLLCVIISSSGPKRLQIKGLLININYKHTLRKIHPDGVRFEPLAGMLLLLIGFQPQIRQPAIIATTAFSFPRPI